MSYEKIKVTHEQEEEIALYCAKNNVEISLGNAYVATMNAFKTKPILYINEEAWTKERTKIDVTARVARYVECQPAAIEHIAEKAKLKQEELYNERIQKNIQKARLDEKPDIDILTDSLYRLNIVDEHSYLALVCFLMQLKYSRDNEISGGDKTCLFFNGLASNGKSKTAEAICRVESNYGKVYNGTSGKILESVHEEEVWKSHLNFFDEVKPSDVDRESLLTIVNGGDIELNPKNKKQYIYLVNTNNIFASNAIISMMQRRVSVVKFGKRLKGGSVEKGVLENIITKIMNSLPDFKYYYDIYNIVSVHNENRVNSLAMANIITFMNEKFGVVNEGDLNIKNMKYLFICAKLYHKK